MPSMLMGDGEDGQETVLDHSIEIMVMAKRDRVERCSGNLESEKRHQRIFTGYVFKNQGLWCAMSWV